LREAALADKRKTLEMRDETRGSKALAVVLKE